jgi:two-component system chemotaxis sensor kinase CheA
MDSPEILKSYKTESNELLLRLNQEMLQLEKKPGNMSCIENMYRHVHTLKGSSSLLGFKSVKEIAHEIENIFLALKEGRLEIQHVSQILFESFDAISFIIDAWIKKQPCDDTVENVLSVLRSIGKGGAAKKESSTRPDETQPARAAEKEPAAETAKSAGEPEAEPAKTQAREHAKEPAAQPVNAKAAEPEKEQGAENVREYGDSQTEDDPEYNRINEMINYAPDLKETVRVSPQKIDTLLNQFGEIMLTHMRFEEYRTNLLEALSELEASEVVFNKAARSCLRDFRSHLKKFGDELEKADQSFKLFQRSVIELRTVPFSTIFSIYPRAVRDLAKERNKVVDLEIRGHHIEIDRKLIELVKDPIMHVLRNAIDHGIEDEKERLARGKPRNGKIEISASEQGDRIFVQIADDGRGINSEKLINRAREMNLITVQESKSMTQSEAVKLIFKSHLSTSDDVNDMSGRGVGMNVVNENIRKKIGGEILVDTSVGRGTKFTFILPPSLITSNILIVECGTEMLAIPIASIEFLSYIHPNDIEYLGGRSAIHIRDMILPIEDLGVILQIKEPSPPGQSELTVVVLRYEETMVACIVDNIIGEENILVKSLEEPLKGTKALGGIAILEWGKPIAVINVIDLIEIYAKKVTPVQMKEVIEKPSGERPEIRKRVLLVEDSPITQDLEKRIIISMGYDVDTADDGMKALDRLEAEQYDVVISDIMMPNLNGLELCMKMKSEKRYEKIPFILVTSLDKDEDIRRGLDAGADAYILKSEFDQENLRETIDRLV